MNSKIWYLTLDTCNDLLKHKQLIYKNNWVYSIERYLFQSFIELNGKLFLKSICV